MKQLNFKPKGLALFFVTIILINANDSFADRLGNGDRGSYFSLVKISQENPHLSSFEALSIAFERSKGRIPKLNLSIDNLKSKINSENNFLWYKISAQDLLSKNSSSTIPNYILKSDDPDVKKLQQLFGTLLTFTLNLMPELRKIPIPTLAVIEENSYNAYVQTLPICIDVPLIWNQKEAEIYGQISYDLDQIQIRPGEKKLHPIGYFVPGSGMFSNTFAMECDRIHVLSKKDLAKLVDYINKNSFEKNVSCRLSVVENIKDIKSAILLNSDCKVDEGLKYISYGSRYLGITPSTSVIVGHRGLLNPKFTDNMRIYTFAHELMHYYLSHSFTEAKVKNYFYDLNENYPMGQAPERKTEFDYVGKMLTSRSGNPFSGFNPSVDPLPVFNARWRTELVPFIQSLLNNDVKEILDLLTEENRRICIEASSLGNKIPNLLQPVQWDNLPEKELRIKNRVLEFEKLATQCFEGTPVAQWKSSVDNGKFINRSEIINDFKLNYSFELACIGDPNLPSEFSNLNDFLDKISNQIEEKNCSHANNLKFAHEHQIGYYSFEQEADELGLLLTSKFNIPTIEAIKKFDVFSSEDNDPNCTLWLKEQEGSVIPILKNYADVHHESCFRKYNLIYHLNRKLLK